MTIRLKHLVAVLVLAIVVAILPGESSSSTVSQPLGKLAGPVRSAGRLSMQPVLASTFSANLLHGLTTTETLSGGDLAAQSQLLHSGFTDTLVLTASSSPDVTNCAYQTYTLVSGAISIDFTNIQLNGNSQSFSGKKLRYLKVKNMSGTNAQTFVKGASNGFTGFGSGFSYTLAAGESFCFYDAGAGTTIGSTVKTIDVTGTGSDTFQVSAACGD